MAKHFDLLLIHGFIPLTAEISLFIDYIKDERKQSHFQSRPIGMSTISNFIYLRHWLKKNASGFSSEPKMPWQRKKQMAEHWEIWRVCRKPKRKVRIAKQVGK